MNERRRLLKEYIRDDADEELDYLTIIPYSDGEPYVSRIAFITPYHVKLPNGTEYYSDIWYSLDGGEWILYSGEYIDVPCFSKIRFKGDWHDVMKNVVIPEDTAFEQYYTPWLYSESGNDWWLLEGTPLSLIHGDNFKEQKNDWNVRFDSFRQMFYENQNIGQINNPKTFLPSTELTRWCYEQMFVESSIVNAPELPAETLKEGCYHAMFGDCYSLEEAPELNAKVFEPNCYSYMFYNCTKLHYAKITAVGSSDNVTEDPMVNMFYGCAERGLVVLSQEMLDSGFGSYYWPNWDVITEDYPTNELGYPEAKGTINDYAVLCLNAEFLERYEWDSYYYNYFMSECNELKKELYDWLTSWMNKGESYYHPGAFINRCPVPDMVWLDHEEDGKIFEYIHFSYIGSNMDYYGLLYPDGSLYFYKREWLIYDYIKK